MQRHNETTQDDIQKPITSKLNKVGYKIPVLSKEETSY